MTLGDVILYIAVGAMILIPAAVVLYIIHVDKKGCTVEVDAEVTGFTSDDFYDPDHPNLTDYQGKYKYTYNGKEYEGYGAGIYPDKHKIGDHIKIYINPDDPSKSSTYKLFQKLVLRNLLLGVLGVIVFGIISWVIYLLISG